jgi:membrane associated rhomboid family serine protease
MMLLCVGAFALQQVGGMENVIAQGAVYGPAITGGQWWRLVTGGFLHGSAMHLAVNMFSLYVLGRLVEPVLASRDSWQFPALYVVSLLGGSFGALILEPDVAAVGASGAIFGLLGAAITIPARLGLGWNGFGVLPWLGLNLMFTFAVPGISRGGHLGGLLAGLLAGWFLMGASRGGWSPDGEQRPL